ncbi:MAG: hypothetical protein ABIJ45_06395 [Candidatus Zixiibacteriota bacterium]
MRNVSHHVKALSIVIVIILAILYNFQCVEENSFPQPVNELVGNYSGNYRVDIENDTTITILQPIKWIFLTNSTFSMIVDSTIDAGIACDITGEFEFRNCFYLKNISMLSMDCSMPYFLAGCYSLEVDSTDTIILTQYYLTGLSKITNTISFARDSI